MKRPALRSQSTGRVKIKRRAGSPPPPASDVSGGLYFANQNKTNISFVHTGCTLLDCVVGGGWALGRVVNIVGDKSTGKTLLAMEAAANFFLQYPNGRVRYNEAEAAFDESYAEALGIPIQKVDIVTECATVEDWFNDLSAFLKDTKKGTHALYILDSLDALSDAAELERGISEGSYGASKPKQLSQMFRRLIRKIEESNVCLIIISQVRDAIGVSFGDKLKRSGGKALDFYASQVVWLAHLKLLKKTINKVERPYGVRIRAKCKKNKVGLPWRECEFELHFGYGIRDKEASLEWLAEVGIRPDKNTSASAETIRRVVQTKWAEIETSFLPKERKYGN